MLFATIFLLLTACTIVGLGIFSWYKMKDIPVAFLIFCLSALVYVSSFVCFNEYKKPHQGSSPQLSDVPEKARIVEIKTIIDNDTTIHYELKWNDAE